MARYDRRAIGAETKRRMARKKTSKAGEEPSVAAGSPISEARKIIGGVLSAQAAEVIEKDATVRPRKMYGRYTDVRAAGIIEAMRGRMLYILTKHGRHIGDAEVAANDAIAEIVANLEQK